MTSTSDKKATEDARRNLLVSLLCGGFAGLAVDIALFPLDTLKTRLQSAQGFFWSGGFRGVYKGLSATAIGSAPGAALFFSTYEHLKEINSANFSTPVVHMIAAAVGECTACIVRVPTEVIKQRLQTGMYKSMPEAVGSILKLDGVSGLYRGFGATILREVPFSLVQFPLYERIKATIKSITGRDAASHEAALCKLCFHFHYAFISFISSIIIV
jgi:solute carrier family 25 (mitochondrial S-adenosylmethionine transporter), member 26